MSKPLSSPVFLGGWEGATFQKRLSGNLWEVDTGKQGWDRVQGTCSLSQCSAPRTRLASLTMGPHEGQRLVPTPGTSWPLPGSHSQPCLMDMCVLLSGLQAGAHIQGTGGHLQRHRGDEGPPQSQRGMAGTWWGCGSIQAVSSAIGR